MTSRRFEISIQKARADLGVEAQRQRSDTVIAVTTLVLLRLFSLIIRLMHQSTARGKLLVRQDSWYTNWMA